MTGCVAGAEYVENIRDMLQNAGFQRIRMTPKENSAEIIKILDTGQELGRFCCIIY
jgi:hypothetical protein